MPGDGTWVLAWLGALPTPALAAAVLLAGGALGTVFFGGLWWTVRRAAASPSPLRWLFGSLALRTAVVVPGVYLVTAGQPVLLGLCVLGFMLARVTVLRMVRPRRAEAAPPGSGGAPCA